MRFYFSILLTLILGNLSFLLSQDWIEIVYLKNGSIIRGIIIEQVPNQSIKIKTSDGSIFVYKMDEVLKIAKEEVVPKEQPKTAAKDSFKIIPEFELKEGETIPSKKEPALAFVLSFLIVGVGQYYNGDVGKGLIQEIGVVGGYLIATTDNSSSSGALAIGLGVIILCDLWSWIDAPVSASNINERREYLLKKEGLQSFKLSPLLYPEKDGGKIGVSIRF